MPILTYVNEKFLKGFMNILKPQIVLAGGLVYNVGDVGSNFFIVKSGIIKVTLSEDLESMDSYSRESFRLLKRKDMVHGDIYDMGNHFGEFSLISDSGFRSERAEALTNQSEIYSIDAEDFWKLIVLLDVPLRRNLIVDFMTKVGEDEHTVVSLDEFANIALDSLHESIFTYAYFIMSEILNNAEDMGNTMEEKRAWKVKRKESVTFRKVSVHDLSSSGMSYQRHRMSALKESFLTNSRKTKFSMIASNNVLGNGVINNNMMMSGTNDARNNSYVKRITTKDSLNVKVSSTRHGAAEDEDEDDDENEEDAGEDIDAYDELGILFEE